MRQAPFFGLLKLYLFSFKAFCSVVIAVFSIPGNSSISASVGLR
jgi:hypothetical protein